MGSKLQPRFPAQHKRRNRGVETIASRLRGMGVVANDASSKRVYRWLSRLADGSPVDYRTPFFATHEKGRIVYTPREQILKLFDPIISRELSKPATVLPAKACRVIEDWEMSNREGVGPMSPYLPWAKDGPIKSAAVMKDKRLSSQFNRRAWARVLERISCDIKSGSLHYLSPEQAVLGLHQEAEEGMDTTTNSGAPFFLAGWKPPTGAEESPVNRERSDVYQWYMAEAQRVASSLRSKVLPTNELPLWWGITGQRLVQKGPKPFSPKSKRLVIAMPKTEAIVAKMATSVAQEAMKLLRTPSGVLRMGAWYDLSIIDQECQKVLRNAATHGRVVLSGDISNFDAAVPPQVLLDLGSAMSRWFSEPALVVNMVKAMVLNTALITPTSLLPPTPSSMKSGSGFTQIIGSLANTAMQYYGEEIGLYKIHSLMVLGDDFILDGHGVCPEATAETFTHFNMEAHPGKQFYERGMLQFLKRTHVLGIPGGMASAYRTLGSTLSFERMQFRPKEWNEYAYIIRCLSQLQNAVFHPAFERLVEFVANGDKYHLGSRMSVHELLHRSGKTGEKLLSDDGRRAWKRQGNVQFSDWAVNRVLRGDALPPLGKARYQVVYGKNFLG